MQQVRAITILRSALKMLPEKYREGQKELHCVLVDLEKTFDRVQREGLWFCMRSLELQRSMLDWCRICMRAV